MAIEFYKSLWGFENLSLDEFATRVLADGYNGVECPMSIPPGYLSTRNLKYIAQDFVETQDSLQEAIDRASEMKAELLNLHIGKDWWPENVVADFLEQSLKRIEESDIPVGFETHRGRIFYSAASTFTC